MPVRFAVIGAGPLGTAAAYDLARYGDADEVRILDSVIGRAQQAADRINRLVRRKVAKAGVVNAAESTGASQVLEGLDGVVAAGPSHLHPAVAEAAIRARVHYVDLGGAAPEVLDLHERAKAAQISVVPDCGAAPGLANLFVAHGMGRMDAPHAVRVRSGDLPETPDLPLGYQPHFTVEALARRYFGRVEQIKDGEKVKVPVFSDLESINVAPLGRLEAFATGGGCDTCSQTYASRLTHFDFKTLRYPGHHQALSLLTQLGFLSR
ncbi:MAG: saccharopine dehydrogenase NADP-binding domain-containing protein, partial [Myxococcota bacterium]